MTTALILRKQESLPFFELWAVPKFEPLSVILCEKNMRLVITQVRKWVLDKRPGAKMKWGRSIPEIYRQSMVRPVRPHGFTPAEIMLGFVPEWRITNPHRNIPGVLPGFIKEALQEDVNEIEEGPEGLSIERLVGKEDERRTLAVWSISENHTRQEGKTRAQWTQPRIGDLVWV